MTNWGVVDGKRYQASLATSKRELEDIFRLRYRVYCQELKQIPAESCADGLERDWCDDHSDFIAVRCDDQLVGCLRLIRCEEGCLLDGASFSGERFSLPASFSGTDEIIQAHECVEASRWIGYAADLSDGRKLLVSMLALEAGLYHAAQMGAKYWIWALKEKSYFHLLGEGWPLREFIPGAHAYHGSVVRVCGARVAPLPCRKFVEPSSTRAILV